MDTCGPTIPFGALNVVAHILCLKRQWLLQLAIIRVVAGIPDGGTLEQKDSELLRLGVCGAQEHKPLREVLAETQNGKNRARPGVGQEHLLVQAQVLSWLYDATSPQSIRNDRRQPPYLNVSWEILKALNGSVLKKYTSHPRARAWQPQPGQGTKERLLCRVLGMSLGSS